MLERNAQTKTELAPPGATPTLDKLPRRIADFATLGEALDALAGRFPRLREFITAGTLHPSLAANLNCDTFVSDPFTPLAKNDRLLILSADAGG